MRTSDLEGLALDWAVAKCDEVTEWKLDPRELQIERQGHKLRYSTDWSQGGEIIEREGISLEYSSQPEKWCACIMADQEVYGPTALIAAMRCYVASKLGEEIEIPEELLS